MLIDTGLGVASLKDAIADLTDKPVTALATHIHFDHVGCLHEFPHRLLHESEAPKMSDYNEFAFLRVPAELKPDLAGYETHGETGSFNDLLINAAPAEEFDVDTYTVQSASVHVHWLTVTSSILVIDILKYYICQVTAQEVLACGSLEREPSFLAMRFTTVPC